MSYTQVELSSPVQEMTQKEETLGLSLHQLVTGVKITLWSCDVCGALVQDQQLHTSWHDA